MSLLSLIIALAVFGLLVWLIVTYVPMPVAVRNIIIGVMVVGLVLYMLNAFGLLHEAEKIRIPGTRGH